MKAANARVIYSLNFPTRRPSLAPDADEALSVLRDRANAPKGPAVLDKAGVLFAFESNGLSDPKDFLKNAQKTVANGLSKDAAIKALTLNAATLAGAARSARFARAGQDRKRHRHRRRSVRREDDDQARLRERAVPK